MLQPGKMVEVVTEITRYELSIITLQEIRWKGQGELKKRAYSIYYNERPGSKRPGLRDTGFYVEKELRKSILLFESD